MYAIEFAEEGKSVKSSLWHQHLLIYNMKRSGLFNVINSHPALILAAGLLFTGGIIFSYRKFIRPVLLERKYKEAQDYAEYLFNEEFKQKLANKPDS